MNIDIEVNNKTIRARKGDTILEALRENGIQIPTLCRLEDFTPTGACRLCVVEVEGKDRLIPACSFPVEEWMKIKTHSQRVIEARKMIVELLLSNHPDDCLYCERNGNCELQRLAQELNIRERRISGKKNKAKLDLSSPGLIHDPAKCVLCGRCVRICEENQSVATLDFISKGNYTSIGAAMQKDLNFSNCIQCGQCILVCPTGALHEKSYFDSIQQAINNEDVKVVAQYSPSVAVSLAEEFDIRSGKDLTGVINAALRKIGFDKVFDSSFGGDLHIVEQAAELSERLDKEENIPLLTSSCPAWIKYIEQAHPDLIPYLSTVKSPEQITGSVVKKYCVNSADRNQNDIFSIAIVPCPSKKFEAQRQEMTSKGIADVDAVMTTRELAKLIKLYGVDVNSIEPEETDQPFSKSSSAGRLPASLGGTAEAVMRTMFYNVTGKDIASPKMSKLRGTKDFKQTKIKMGDLQLNVAAVSPLNQVENILEDIKNGRSSYHYIEVMACPGGCVNGGGQPFMQDEKNLKNRAKSVQAADDKSSLRFAHKNQSVKEFYQQYFDKPNSETARKVLHTKYGKREVLQ
jgi:iron-only hydrogenase group A